MTCDHMWRACRVCESCGELDDYAKRWAVV
jgi:hypothetical protein